MTLGAGMRTVAVLAGVLVLAGCSSIATIWSPTAQTENIRLETTPEVNDTFPVAVDIVAVSDKAFVEVLDGVDAATWFERRQAFMNDRSDAMEVRSFELVPGQRELEIGYNYFDRRDFRGIYVFAQYVNAGNHKARVDSYSRPTVVLGAEGIRVQPEG